MNNFLTLENEYLKLQVDTLFGGKIVEIFDKKNKANWVWFDGEKYKNFNPNQYSDYDSQWIGGYEELFPSDKIETFNSQRSPDHGELWASSWDIINKSKSSLELFCKGYFSNSEIIKRIEIQNNKIFINYEISKISLDYFLFKLHLALPIERNSINFKFDSFKKVDDSFGNIVVGNDLNDFISSITPSQRKNDFVYFYEKGLRANKIGIPAGVWSGQLPQNVEAYYKSDISKILAIEALQASADFFNGIHFGDSQTNGESLYDYLAYLDDTNYSDSSMFIGLEDDIVDSFDNSMIKINVLNDNFALQIETDNMKMLEAYDAIQQGVVRLKTNMLSILGIAVDYYDADGD